MPALHRSKLQITAFALGSLMALQPLGSFAEVTKSGANVAPLALAQQIAHSKRIVFLGDSITAGSGYVIGVSGALLSQRLPNGGPEVLSAGLSSETVSGLSEEGHGGKEEKAFPRPCIFERLSRVLDLLRPDTVFACYGINCGIYMPFDETRFEAFQKGMIQLHETVEKAGGRIVHITPPFFDVTRKPNQEFYPAVMLKYAAWLVSKRAEGWQVIDLHTAMKAEVERRRESDPTFTMSPDGIHPNAEGHWLMAQQILGWLGDEEVTRAASLENLFQTRQIPAEAATLVSQRVSLTRDSYVQAAGHKRPGVAKGLPVEDAQAKAAEIDQQLTLLLSKK